ncbi:peptidoglycan DD-metalloendopeptidase family protein [Microvirga sp. W0021]|uniref:Peptidoglycan DD-metalloendopeptidase family protein n=1 Tax=Hohaiivirga grylli TaxID=3133970 RepID=A0ABV0BMA4_9HYPH
MLTTGGNAPDLGNEPPLDAAGSNAEIIDRREVNLRWLGASILIGITGGALIGASVYIAFQGLTSLVEQPRKARYIPYQASAPDNSSATPIIKGDKLVRQSAASDNKNGDALRIPITTKIGNREIIKVRQFIRVATPLSTTSGLYASNIPPFNPMKLMAQGDDNNQTEELPAPQPEITDADVSITRADLTHIVFKENQQTLSDSDALAQLETELSLLKSQGQRSGLPITPQFLLSRPLQSLGQLTDVMGGTNTADNFFSGIEVRVIPENVTNITKDTAAQPDDGDKEYQLKKGETLKAFLLDQRIPATEVDEIIQVLGKSVKVSSLGEGQTIRILYGENPLTNRTDDVLRVTLVSGKKETAIAALSDRGEFVSVMPIEDTSSSNTAVASAKGSSTEEEEEEKNAKLGTARIYESLYETAAKNNMPTDMVQELVKIFGSDVDFQRRVSPGDSIEILYSVDDETGEKPEMLFAAFVTNGEARKLYRYQSDDGSVDYLDSEGRSLKRFLLRKPITDGILRSGFGMRRHPVLRYSKMHTGVDWANKIGTPILAAGNGTIIVAGWKSGYGMRIEIQHANGYVTSYSHQSRFAEGSTVGARVRQGQVIGYVGTTGLSTGPHLHYEVEVNGHLVDPLKIRVPRGRELNGTSLADFVSQRKQIDMILDKAGSSIAVARDSSE